MLQIVDPNELFGLYSHDTRETLLHYFADLAEPFDYSTHENQLILSKQLIEHGANVNAISDEDSKTPLHKAYSSGNVINLDFVEYLLGEGADPNAQDDEGMAPLIYAIPDAPGAAKFLQNWPTTDANITLSGTSFLRGVGATVKRLSCLSINIALPENPDKVQHQFLLQ
jgi:hypothetical protein